MRQTMNDDDTTQDRWLTTEQIATAGNAPTQEDAPDQEYAADQEDAPDQEDAADQEDAPDQEYAAAPTGHPGREDDLGVPLAAAHAASGQADRIAPGTGNGNGA